MASLRDELTAALAGAMSISYTDEDLADRILPVVAGKLAAAESRPWAEPVYLTVDQALRVEAVRAAVTLDRLSLRLGGTDEAEGLVAGLLVIAEGLYGFLRAGADGAVTDA